VLRNVEFLELVAVVGGEAVAEEAEAEVVVALAGVACHQKSIVRTRAVMKAAWTAFATVSYTYHVWYYG